MSEPAATLTGGKTPWDKKRKKSWSGVTLAWDAQDEIEQINTIVIWDKACVTLVWLYMIITGHIVPEDSRSCFSVFVAILWVQCNTAVLLVEFRRVSYHLSHAEILITLFRHCLIVCGVFRCLQIGGSACHAVCFNPADLKPQPNVSLYYVPLCLWQLKIKKHEHTILPLAENENNWW